MAAATEIVGREAIPKRERTLTSRHCLAAKQGLEAAGVPIGEPHMEMPLPDDAYLVICQSMRAAAHEARKYSWPIPGERDLRGREFPGTPGNSHSRWEFPGVWEIRGEPGRGSLPEPR